MGTSMTEVNRPDSQRKFIPSLEGVRGYAFLLVFFAHCCNAIGFFPLGRWWYPVRLLEELEWAAVPIFFVLSGYLIGGILIDTREREGYFKVFYRRRILRVFPLYYLTLIGVGLCCVLKRLFPWFSILESVPVYPQSLPKLLVYLHLGSVESDLTSLVDGRRGTILYVVASRGMDLSEPPRSTQGHG